MGFLVIDEFNKEMQIIDLLIVICKVSSFVFL